MQALNDFGWALFSFCLPNEVPFLNVIFTGKTFLYVKIFPEFFRILLFKNRGRLLLLLYIIFGEGSVIEAGFFFLLLIISVSVLVSFAFTCTSYRRCSFYRHVYLFHIKANKCICSRFTLLCFCSVYETRNNQRLQMV